MTPGAAGPIALCDVDPDAVAALVTACPAVARLSAGPFGGAATYLPGRKVAGVRISPDSVEVHVVARYGTTVAQLARQVRAALAGRALGRTVDIVVEDLDDQPDTAAQKDANLGPVSATPRHRPAAVVAAADPGSAPMLNPTATGPVLLSSAPLVRGPDRWPGPGGPG